MFEQIGEPQPRWFRFTLNLVLDAAGIPEGMAHDVAADGAHQQDEERRQGRGGKAGQALAAREDEVIAGASTLSHRAFLIRRELRNIGQILTRPLRDLRL